MIRLNSKHEIRSSPPASQAKRCEAGKQIRNSNFETNLFRIWDLELRVCLVIGASDFEFV